MGQPHLEDDSICGAVKCDLDCHVENLGKAYDVGGFAEDTLASCGSLTQPLRRICRRRASDPT